MKRDELGAYLGVPPEKTARLDEAFAARFADMPAPTGTSDEAIILDFQQFLQRAGRAPAVVDESGRYVWEYCAGCKQLRADVKERVQLVADKRVLPDMYLCDPCHEKYVSTVEAGKDPTTR